MKRKTYKQGMQQAFVADLIPSKLNPRRVPKVKKGDELLESVREQGILMALTCRPLTEEQGGGLEIIAGERRFQVAKKLGLEKVPVYVRHFSDAAALEAMLSENLARAELNPMEESDGVRALVEMGEEVAQVSQALGRGQKWVQLRLDLGDLPQEAQEAVRAREAGFTLGVAQSLLALEGKEQVQAVQAVLDLEVEERSEGRVKLLLEQRYFEPRRLQKQWEKRRKVILESLDGFEHGVDDVLEHWGEAHEFVTNWGEAEGGWKIAKSPVGLQAAREEDRGLYWGDLARAHGLGWLAVPYERSHDNPAQAPIAWLVDAAKIKLLEEGLKAEGKEYTLGQRVKEEKVAEVGEIEEGGELDHEAEEHFPDGGKMVGGEDEDKGEGYPSAAQFEEFGRLVLQFLEDIKKDESWRSYQMRLRLLPLANLAGIEVREDAQEAELAEVS